MADPDSHGTCWHLCCRRSCLHAQALVGMTNQANATDLSCIPSGPSLQDLCMVVPPHSWTQDFLQWSCLVLVGTIPASFSVVIHIFYG